jgi:dTDP-4-amino-4,6-dideoxygalactose transaminase
MDALHAIADQYRLLGVEDACQAQGAAYDSAKGGWKRAGSFGKAGAFSFYPGKNLGACGEAGAVTTDDEQVAKTIKMLREHGQITKYYHDLEGYNGRLDAIQAAFLRIKLRHLEEWNEQRRAAAVRYDSLLAGMPNVATPYQPANSKSIYHLYVIRTNDREGLGEHLKAANIQTGLHYPLPVHLQNCYKSWGYQKGSLPVTERVASEILSLPMFPGLTKEQQERIATGVDTFLGVTSQRTGR